MPHSKAVVPGFASYTGQSRSPSSDVCDYGINKSGMGRIFLESAATKPIILTHSWIFILAAL